MCTHAVVLEVGVMNHPTRTMLSIKALKLLNFSRTGVARQLIGQDENIVDIVATVKLVKS